MLWPRLQRVVQKKKEGVVDPRMKRKITHEEMAELFGRVTIGKST